MEQALASIIITKLHLFQVEREFFLGDAVELDKPLLGVAPKSLDAVYVNFAVGKEFLMVKVDMPIAAEHERIVAPEFVGIDDAAAPHCFNRKVEERTSLNVLDGLDLDHSITLQDAENRHFSGCSTASLALAPSAEVALVHLHDSAEKVAAFGGCGNDGSAYRVDRLEDRRITESRLLSYPSGRKLQLEKFDDPEPVLIRDAESVNPPAGKVMEGIPASLTSEPLADNSIYLTASAPCAKTTAVFPTRLCEKEPRRILSLYKGFK